MFRKNNLSLGVGLGILLPLFVFGFFQGINSLLNMPFRVRTLAMIAVCVNLLLVRFYQRQYMGESLRGAAVATMLLAILWLVFFGQEIMGELNQ